MHWAVKYIGMPYEEGGRGPNKVDCWGLLCLAYKQEKGIELPPFPGISASSALAIHSTIQGQMGEQWVEVSSPFDMAAVAMGQNSNVDSFHHVGLYSTADGGRIIHSYGKHNVVADSLPRIAAKNFRNVKYYRHLLWLS